MPSSNPYRVSPAPITGLTCTLSILNDVIHVAATQRPARKRVIKCLKCDLCRVTRHIGTTLHICPRTYHIYYSLNILVDCFRKANSQDLCDVGRENKCHVYVIKDLIISLQDARDGNVVGHPEQKKNVGIFEYILASMLTVYLDVCSVERSIDWR